MRFLLLSFLLSLFAFADDPIVGDPFAPSAEELLITKGALKNQSIRPDRRPIIRISEEERVKLGLPDLGPDILWVANFYEKPPINDQLFHIAAIPLNAVEKATKEVVDRSKYNPPKGASFWQRLVSVGPHFHTQLAFDFSSDVLLFSQKTDPSTGKLLNPQSDHSLKRITFSVGGLRPEQRFDPHHAISGAYKKALLFVGQEEAYRDLSGGAKLQPFELELPKEKLRDFLTEAADQSTRDRLSKPYNAMKDGCLSSTLDILGRILFQRPPASFPYSWPSSAESVRAEFTVRNIKTHLLEEVSYPPEKVKTLKDKGAFGPRKLHPYTRITRSVGLCAGVVSRVLTKRSLKNIPAK